MEKIQEEMGSMKSNGRKPKIWGYKDECEGSLDAFESAKPKYESGIDPITVGGSGSKAGKVPVRKGCRNKGGCFCTGACQEIIGYRDKLPGEV